MANNFSKLPNPALTEKASNIVSVMIENPAEYGVTTSQCEYVEDSREQLEIKSALAEQANQSKLAAYALQEAERQTLLVRLSDLAKRVYATESVTDAALLKAGLSPRPTRSARPALTPTNLVADELTANRVRLKWSRAGNSSSAIFVVETRGQDTEWTTAGQFTKTRIVLEGFDAGVPAYFRVVAVKNNARSLPSNEAVIYVEDLQHNLKIA